MPRDIVKSFVNAFEEGLTEAMEDTYREALRKSSGPYSLYEIAHHFDHAFARRHPEPALDPTTINDQTGEFKEHWHSPEVIFAGGDLIGRIVNDSDVADFLRLGTRYMIPRDIEGAVESYAEQDIPKRIDSAVRKWDRKKH